jgi:hypothetical protein
MTLDVNEFRCISGLIYPKYSVLLSRLIEKRKKKRELSVLFLNIKFSKVSNLRASKLSLISGQQ